jgi:hypothetical protein
MYTGFLPKLYCTCVSIPKGAISDRFPKFWYLFDLEKLSECRTNIAIGLPPSEGFCIKHKKWREMEVGNFALKLGGDV